MNTEKLVKSVNTHTQNIIDINSSLETMESKTKGFVNVKEYGVVGDGKINDTDNFIKAFKDAKGRKIIVPDGNYLVDYFKLSGKVGMNDYINTNVIEIEFVGDVNFIPNDFLHKEYNPNLGIEWGYTPSIFMLNQMNGVKMNGFKVNGHFFNDFINDSKPVTADQGTFKAYHTTTKCINLYQCNNIIISDIQTEKMYGCLYMRECKNFIINNITHKYSRQAYLFEDCEIGTFNNLKSFDARFGIEQTLGETCDIYNRTTGELLYTVPYTSDRGGLGLKVTAGYGFVIGGGRNLTFNNCISERSGSECFRTQSSPLGNKAESIYFNDCKSYQACRYAYSVRGKTNTVIFTDCKAIHGVDLDFYNGEPPLTLQECLEGAKSNDEYDTHWSFRLPRSSNCAFFGSGENTQFINCQGINKKTLYSNLGDSSIIAEIDKKKTRYVFGFDGLAFNDFYMDYSIDGDNILIDGCYFEGLVGGEFGAFRLGMYNSNSKLKITNCKLNAPLDSVEANKQKIMYIGNTSMDIELKNNSFIGGYVGLYVACTTNSPSRFVCEDTDFTSHRYGTFFVSDTYLKFIFRRGNIKAIYPISLSKATFHVLFDNVNFIPDNANNIIVQCQVAYCMRGIYFKEGKDFVFYVNMETSAGNTQQNGFQTVYEKIRINRIECIENTSSVLDNFSISIPILDGTNANNLSKDLILAKVYNSSDILRNLKVRITSGGTGYKQYGFWVDNADVVGQYKIYYTPLKSTLDNKLF